MKHLSILGDDDDDPMLSAVNLVDVFLVLVVALLAAVGASSASDASAVRRAGQPDMELVVREHGREVRFKGAGGASAGDGVRAGVAYRLADGSVVYVPEPEASGTSR